MSLRHRKPNYSPVKEDIVGAHLPVETKLGRFCRSLSTS